MAVFYFKCPFCEKEIKAYSEWHGRTGLCPYCDYDVIIRDPEIEIKNFNKTTVRPPEQEEKQKYSLPEGVPILSGKKSSSKNRKKERSPDNEAEIYEDCEDYDDDDDDDDDDDLLKRLMKDDNTRFSLRLFACSQLFKK